jgi:hypothetical protein
MNSDHRGIMPRPALDRAPSPKPTLVPTRIPKLEQALKTDETDACNEVHGAQEAPRPATKS